ncbi:sugar transferase [Cellulophaga algicola DSM 14237]|uniref:Sugar transferase n=1 Tax=Cellulophaga algicola (strain DSM 14237 / IC166 / ACAM 630) TaxID=688270 RepID=E6X461_CELAD|nr:sugar transferase [Cellulophaga algicola]ADV50403.1 sugar transferase [Cellulophaga algicola DSM 14237]
MKLIKFINRTMYKKFLKRIIDFCIALALLFILSPIFFSLIIINAIINGNPFFTQLRPGKNEIIFQVIKFKTMNDKKDKNNIILPDNERLTKFGIFLRKTSLDEIPQLINVLKGDMSLIGPRPLLVQYLPYYNTKEKLRHTVRPGITGLAQISGRNFISWEEKFKFDIEYVNKVSLLLDLRIILQTISKVINRKDVAVATNEVSEYFDAYRKKQFRNV